MNSWLNWPNRLSLLRILAVPLIVLLLYFPNRITCLLALVLFLLAALTDLVDGLWARRKNLVTNLGKFLDPLADKLLIASVLIMLVHLKWAPAWVVVLIVGRELAVTGLRAVAVEQGIVMAADKFGKAKTILQIAALCPLIFHYDIGQFDPKPAGMALLYAALVLTVVSGANYMRGFFAGLRRKGEEI